MSYWKSTLTVSTIFVVRMLGLFMILPVFSLYAQHIKGCTPILMGVAMGIYGLTQAALQMPFGVLSDLVGRKKVIVLGLCLMALGSLIAAFSHSIMLIIVGRALQGAGAIGSTLMALLSDLTPNENRATAMAILGASIGISFALAMVIGPLLESHIGLQGVFVVTAVLAFSGIVILYGLVPTPPTIQKSSNPLLQQLRHIMLDRQLWLLDISVFFQHLLLTALFVGLPLLIKTQQGWIATHSSLLYLWVLLISFVVVFPLLRRLTLQLQHSVWIAAIMLLMLAALGLWCVTQSYAVLLIPSLLLFFIGFNFLEAALPARISQCAPPENKGAAMGIYSSLQFFGMFCGGVMGGTLYGSFGLSGLFMGCSIVALCWCVIFFYLTYTSSKHVGQN